eukprot:6214754-Pleurochrysis_carterae.AAC.1
MQATNPEAAAYVRLCRLIAVCASLSDLKVSLLMIRCAWECPNSLPHLTQSCSALASSSTMLAGVFFFLPHLGWMHTAAKGAQP